MEIDMDVYFWMVDRGLFDDDQRNKVDTERNKVKLHREHSQRFENAFYIGKILLMFKKSIMKISKRPFTLDPAVQNMKDNITSTAKQQNWSIIVKELKVFSSSIFANKKDETDQIIQRFGIRVDSEKKAKIIEGRTQHINEILAKLFDFDNNGGIQGRFQDLNNSEAQIAQELAHNNDSTNVSLIDGNSPVIQNSKKGNLEPLPRFGKKDSVQSVTSAQNILTGSSSKQNLGQGTLKQQAISVSQSITSLNDLQETKELVDSETTLEFILLSLAKNLGIKPKQAAGLLSNNHKYLVHIAVKGMKGGDFSKIQLWYQDLYQHAKTLVQLIDTEKEHNSMKLTMTILKVGLYSQNVDLVINCSRLLSKIGQEINAIGGELCGHAWEWLITKDNVTNRQGVKGGEIPELVNDLNTSLVPQGQQDHPLSESGLSSCLFALKRHQPDLIDQICPIMIHFGKNNPMELFTHHIRNHFENSQEPNNAGKGLFIAFIHEMMIATSETTLFRENIVNTGVFDEWINYALRLADFDTNQSNTPFERTAALAFLADCWSLKAEKFDDGQNSNDTAQVILSVLKRGCRDRSKVLRIVSFELTFKLLHDFSTARNPFAPILYKTLTFLLIEFHQDGEIREQLMRHFITLFQQVQTIPVAILCDPLIKQIEIAQSASAAPTLQNINNFMVEPSYSFNIYDFEFFNVLAHHKRINIQTALSIMDLMISIANTNIFFANTAIGIILEIIHKFSKEPLLHSNFTQIARTQLIQLDEIERARQRQESEKNKLKEEKQKQLQDSLTKQQRTIGSPNKLQAKKLFDQDKSKEQEQNQNWEAASLARQTKEKLIVNLLKQVIMFGNEMIKQNIRTQLLGLYTKIERELKIQSKPIKYLLMLYGEELPKMLQYFVDHERNEFEESNKDSINTEQITQQIERVSQTLFKPKDAALLAALNDSVQSTMSMDSPVPAASKKLKHLDKVLKDIEKIKQSVNEKNQRKQLEEELKKAKEDKQKAIAKRAVDDRKIFEHGVPNKGKSVDAAQGRRKKAPEEQPMEHVKLIKPKDDISEIHIEEEQRLIVPTQNEQKDKPKNPVLKQLKQFQLYDIRLEEQKDQDAVRFFVKKHLKIFRNLFNKYANTSGPVTNVKETFDSLQQKNTQINLAEIFKFLKDFEISNVSASKDDIIQMVRLINMTIFKKKNGNQSSLSILDFEGFVEFMLQLAVHLYHFEQEMLPQEYLQKLLDYLKQIAQKKNLNNAKLFDDPTQQQIGDPQLLQELTRRLQNNPNFQLPEGFQKQVEKEVTNQFKIPEHFPIKESKRIVIEVLDGILFDKLGFHFLEPMSEIKEVVRVKPNLKAQAKDKIIHEINSVQNERHQVIPRRGRSRQPALKGNKAVSTSIDANPIRSLKNLIPTSNLVAQNANASLIVPSTFKSPRPQLNASLIQPVVKPQLSVILKVEVANTPQQERPHRLQTAYVLEEILQAVEQGLDKLPDPSKAHITSSQQRPRIINRITEERLRKDSEEAKQRISDKQKLELRKKMLKDQLDKMKVEKEAKQKEEEAKKQEQDKKEEERKKRQEDKKKADIKKLMQEIEANKEKKRKEEEEKKKQEEEKLATERSKKKKSQLPVESVKQKTAKLMEEFKKKAEDRKASQQREEENSKKKQELDKKKQVQIKQMYQENKSKAKEQKEKLRQEFMAFMNDQMVKEKINSYEKSLQGMFEQYCKFDSIEPGKLSYNSYLKFGQKANIMPQLINRQDFIYVYKTILRSKNPTSSDQKEDFEGTKLNFSDFKEALVRIACLSKFKLGGLNGDPEELKVQEEKANLKLKTAISSVELQRSISRKNTKALNESVNDSLVNLNDQSKDKIKQSQQQLQPVVGIFERDFDVSNMTAQTLENLFKTIGLKPDKAALNNYNSQNTQALNRQINGESEADLSRIEANQSMNESSIQDQL